MTSSNVFIHSNSEFPSFLNFLYLHMLMNICVCTYVYFLYVASIYLFKTNDVWDLGFNSELSSGVWEVIIRHIDKKSIGHG